MSLTKRFRSTANVSQLDLIAEVIRMHTSLSTIMGMKNDLDTHNAFDIQHYKLLAKYLTCLGINPYQNSYISNAIVTGILISSITIFGPTLVQLHDTIRDGDLDGIIEDLPLIITGFFGVLKVVNIRSNKMRFKRLFDSVTRGWYLLEPKQEFCMLDKLSEQGGNLATLYRRTLLMFLVIFLLTPLLKPTLDIIVPLNESRPRHHLFNVNYVFLDAYDHFYAAYMHMAACSAFVVFMIVTVDSLYITIIYHACGLFAVCGYQVKRATDNTLFENNKVVTNNERNEEMKECVMMHHDAILFYTTLERCCRNLYLIQMGLNMLIISLTAVEVVMYLGRLEELIRAIIFLVAQKFHLYVISLPGQMLLDESMGLGEKIYDSNWYQMPVNIQRALYTMQIRTSRACILTAGGLLEMRIETFGMTVKTCISYITMFLSLRE